MIIKKEWKTDTKEKVKYEMCVVSCKWCSRTHASVNVNPGNFARTHFQNHKDKPVCKIAQKKGGLCDQLVWSACGLAVVH